MEQFVIRKPKKEEDGQNEGKELKDKGKEKDNDNNEEPKEKEIKNEETSQDYHKYYPKKPNFYKVPLDEKGFAVSFTVDQKEESKKFFNKYGMVVYRNVISSEDCSTTIEALYCWLEQTRPTFKRNDLSTWENKNWPSGIKFGFLSDYPIYHLQESWNNRQNPNVHRAFANIWDKEELWVSFDRFGFMRPTVGITINGKKTTRATWRSDEYFLHLDQNPIADPEFCRLQGLISLRDNREEDGGFQCVPGFHTHFKEWGKRVVNQSRSHLVNVPEDDPQLQYKQHIPLAKGSLLIWDSRLTHGNYPNKSSHPRIVQYVTMWPAKENPMYVRKRKESIASGEMLNSYDMAGTATKPPRWKRKNFVEPNRPSYSPPQLTELGKKLAGLTSWYSKPKQEKEETKEEEEEEEEREKEEKEEMEIEETEHKAKQPTRAPKRKIKEEDDEENEDEEEEEEEEEKKDKKKKKRKTDKK